MIRQVKLICKKSYDELEEAINKMLADKTLENVSLDQIIVGNDGNMVAVIYYSVNNF